MARERAKLSEKEERILIQSQLMGLTTANMIRIGNRLRALDIERQQKEMVSSMVEGRSYSKQTNGWKIIDRDGVNYDFNKIKVKRKNYYEAAWAWEVTITKPGTRFVPKKVDKISRYSGHYDDPPQRLCPENSKELFGVLKILHSVRIS